MNILPRDDVLSQVRIEACKVPPDLRNFFELELCGECYVCRIIEVFREVRRVLRDDGTLWLNLGDSYCSQGGVHDGREDNQPGVGAKRVWRNGCGRADGIVDERGQRNRNGNFVPGLKPKDLCGIPWRVAFALQADGWYLRSDIIWHKPNPMPESVTDRPTKAHEYLFLLAKSERYFYDAEAIKEPSTEPDDGRERVYGGINKGQVLREQGIRIAGNVVIGNGSTRNRRSVWTIPTSPYPESHFATFPPDLVKPCILAGTSAKGCCPKCGAPWKRIVESNSAQAQKEWSGNGRKNGCLAGGGHEGRTGQWSQDSKTLGWQPTCDCGESSTVPCTVADPFAGSFTTCQVALELGRHAIGIELNPQYVELGRKRCDVTPGLPLA